MTQTRHTTETQRPWPQQAAFVMFCVTSVQLALLKTFVPVIPGLRVDVYSGILCALTFGFAVMTSRSGSFRATWPEIIASAVLFVFALLSGFYSVTPLSSTAWALSWSANALGGFWAARILLDTRFRKKVFVWLCAGTIHSLIALSLWGYYFHGLSQYFVDNLHQLVNITLLLSFSSLTLIATKKPIQALIGLYILVSSYVTLYVCGVGGVEAAVLIPPAILIPGMVIMLFRSRARVVPLVIALLCVIITAHYMTWVSSERFSEGGYQQERIEFYPFSAHVASKSPWVGIGLRTHRVSYLEDYELRFTRQTKGHFAGDVGWLVTSQNMFLTFMTGFGIPFALIYVGCLVLLMARLTRASLAPDPDSVIPPLALFIPLSGAILHYFMMDILIQPQIAWFFHVLLALVPVKSGGAQMPGLNLKRAILYIVCGISVVIIGIIIGTHPALKPGNLPSLTEIGDKAKKLPVVSVIANPRPAPKTTQGTDTGWLQVNLKGYEGHQTRWAVVCIVDNSTDMLADERPWAPNRYQAAVDAINHLASNLPQGSQVMVKGFVEEGPFRKKGTDLGFRLSQVLVPWTEVPAKGNLVPDDLMLTAGPNNVCNAVESALKRDLSALDSSLNPRLLVITDKPQNCPQKTGSDAAKAFTNRQTKPDIDYMILGPVSDQANYMLSTLIEAGAFRMLASNPEALTRSMDSYIQRLNEKTLAPVILVKDGVKVELQPGRLTEAPAGVYDILLPQASDPSETSAKSHQIRIVAGENRILDVQVGKEGFVLEEVRR